MFKDRKEAGQKRVGAVMVHKNENPVVLAALIVSIEVGYEATKRLSVLGDVRVLSILPIKKL